VVRGRRVFAIGIVLGLVTASWPTLGLYRALSGRVEVDPERLQLIAALGVAVVLSGAVAGAARSVRLGVLAGSTALVTGVLLPVWVMSANEAPPQGLHWRLDLNRLLANEAVLTAAASCLVMVVAALATLRPRSLRRPRLRHAAIATLVLATAAVVAHPAVALAMFGPTYAVHHLEMPQAQPPAIPAAGKAALSFAQRCLAGHSTLSEVRVPSAALGGDRSVLVQLPAGYPKCAPPTGYPVVYLLHGDPGGEHDWTHIGAEDIFDAGHAAGLGAYIVVYPDGGGGPWTDWADTADGHWRIGSFIATDLVDYVDHQYATSASARQRFIGGLSSGGFGAASLALAHTNTFGGFLSFSGYYRTGLPVSSSRSLPQAASPDQLAGLPGASSVHVVIGTGLQDGPFTDEAARYRGRLSAAGFDVDYVELPGGHSSHLWRDLLWQSLPTVHRWAALPTRTGHKL
jgi:enterochelin esterase-like enzyme